MGYLWRREQVDLLQDMVDAGMESIIVKVASIGLNPRRHLGKTIGMLQYDFLRLVSQAFDWGRLPMKRKLTGVCLSLERAVPDERLWRRWRVRDLHARLPALQEAHRHVRVRTMLPSVLTD